VLLDNPFDKSKPYGVLASQKLVTFSHYFVVKPGWSGCLAGESNAGHVTPVELYARTHGPLRGTAQL